MEPLFYLENDEDDVVLLRVALKKLDCPNVVRWFRSSGQFQNALLALPEEQLPKVILLDLKLDGEYGLDTLDWLSKDQRLSRIPTFIFSSGRLLEEISESLEQKAAGYIFKPSSIEEWLEIGRELKSMIYRVEPGSEPVRA